MSLGGLERFDCRCIVALELLYLLLQRSGRQLAAFQALTSCSGVNCLKLSGSKVVSFGASLMQLDY